MKRKTKLITLIFLFILQKSLAVISNDLILDNLDEEYFYNVTNEIANSGTTNSKLSLTALVIKEISEGVIGSIKIYKKSKEKYHPLGSEISKDICLLLTTEKMFIPGLRRYGNFPTKCPIQPDLYTVKEYIVPVKDFPPVIPNGDYKFEFQMTLNDHSLIVGTWYGRVQPK